MTSQQLLGGNQTVLLRSCFENQLPERRYFQYTCNTNRDFSNVKFRVNISSLVFFMFQDSGKQDHNFNGKMTLIWAYGQSGVDFYKKDEFKYHSGRNRGRHNLGNYLTSFMTIALT